VTLSAPLLTQHYVLVEQVIGVISRRHRLSIDEREELASHVRLKLLEQDEAILRKFKGQSSLRTYLTTVIERLFLDFRIARWGKWRPSVQAKRLGATAVLLEQLTGRDGLTYDEAETLLHTKFQVDEAPGELAALYAQLPRRTPRRLVDDRALDEMPAAVPDAEQGFQQAEQRAHAERAIATLEQVLKRLPARDRLVLQLRFEQNLSVAAIARTLGVDQKPLYRQLDDLLKDVRSRLEAEGVVAADVREWFGDSAML
jgi:RNA polymerase sigma factor (sigma-70 family)